MEAQVRVNPNIMVKVEGENIKALFEAVAVVQEAMAEAKCGLCGCAELRFKVRPASDGKKTFKYYELNCTGCFARLSFGQSQDTTTLFAKRKLGADGQPDMEGGSYGRHNGWYKWSGRADGQG